MAGTWLQSSYLWQAASLQAHPAEEAKADAAGDKETAAAGQHRKAAAVCQVWRLPHRRGEALTGRFRRGGGAWRVLLCSQQQLAWWATNAMACVAQLLRAPCRRQGAMPATRCLFAYVPYLPAPPAPAPCVTGGGLQHRSDPPALLLSQAAHLR